MLNRKLPKKKIAMFLAYSGTDYHGMQINGDLPTIESTLFTSLCKIGAVSSCNADSITKIGFMRSCRTDKGVHVAAQLVSFKSILPHELGISEDEFIIKINESLPPSIRVFGFVQVAGGFHSQKACDSRIYEYLFPLWILGDSDREQKLCEVESLLAHYQGTHCFHNFTIGKDGKDPSAKRFIKSFTLSKVISTFSIPQTLEESFSEWRSLKVHGQSFMLHQIRKMVGLVFLLVRQKPVIPMEIRYKIMDKLFDPVVKANVPKAPSVGLLLERPFFETYNSNPACQHRERISFEKYEDEITHFKESVIYPQILKEEQEQKCCSSWIACIEEHSYEFDSYLKQDLLASEPEILQ